MGLLSQRRLSLAFISACKNSHKASTLLFKERTYSEEVKFDLWMKQFMIIFSSSRMLRPRCRLYWVAIRTFTKYCACHEKWHYNFTKYCACHEKCHLNFTKYCTCHEKWHLNFTKYCACHAERLTYLVLIAYETSFTVRGATGVTIQPHQILRLPRKMTRLLYRPHIWNVISNARSNRCHYPTSPNTAPATKNDTARPWASNTP